MAMKQEDAESNFMTWLAIMIAAGILSGGMACLAQTSDQDLAAVARQTRAKAKPTHIVTNDEIPSVPQAASMQEDSKGSAGSTEATAGDDTTKAAGNKQAANSKAAQAHSKGQGVNVPGLLTDGTLDEAKALLGSLKHDRQALLDNYDKIQRKLADEQDDSLRRVYSDSLARRDETLAKNQKQIDDTEKAIQIAVQARGEQGDNQHEAQ